MIEHQPPTSARVGGVPPVGRRRRVLRAVVAPLLVVGVGLGAAACGDDDDAEPPADTTFDDDYSDGFDETTIVGLPVDEARSLVEADGRQFREAVIDGEDQVLTMDLVEGRVNVVVTDGLVESVAFYG